MSMWLLKYSSVFCVSGSRCAKVSAQPAVLPGAGVILSFFWLLLLIQNFQDDGCYDGRNQYQQDDG